MKIERQLRALVEAGMILSSELDLNVLLQRIADLAREVVGARYAAVGVLGESGDLDRFVYSGIDHATADQIGDLPRGRGVLGVLIEEGKPLRLRHISGHARSFGFPEHHPPMESFLGVPIVVRGQVFGRLYLTEKQDAAEFTKDDERIALTLASQAGVAVENARLYLEVEARRDELARRMSELSSLETVAGLLIAERPAEEVAASAVNEALVLTDATRALLLMLDEATGDAVIRHAAGDLSEDLVGMRLRSGVSKAHAVMRRLKGEVVVDLDADPEVDRETIERIGRPATGAFVPVMLRGRGIGVLAVYDPMGATFGEEDLAILQILANHIGIAFENERLTASLQDLAVFEERDRIAKELHDGVIQSIYSVGLSLQGTMPLLERDPSLARKRIDEVIAELDNTVRDVRGYIFELRPKSVEEHGLEGAIEGLVRDFEVNTLAETTVDLGTEACGRLSESDQSHIVQIVREVLSNIARHSHATQLSLTCASQGDEVVLTIEDDGRTYDPDEVNRGHGLTNLTERARKVKGRLSIRPRGTKGMQHELRIPIGDKN